MVDSKAAQLLALAKTQIVEEEDKRTVAELKIRLREIGETERILKDMKGDLERKLSEIDEGVER